MDPDLAASLYRDLAFFACDEGLLFDEPARPLSLCSHAALRIMGLKGLIDDPEWEVTVGEVAVYTWLHTQPIDEVCRGIWNGSWRGILNEFEAPAGVDQGQTTEDTEATAGSVLGEFEELRLRLREQILAAGVRIQPRPKGKNGDDSPPGLVGPSSLAFQVAVVMRETSMRRQEVKWELPIAEALQIYHAGLRWAGIWTLRALAPTKIAPAAFEDFGPGFLADEIDAPESVTDAPDE